jgi:DNA (cytosine-5)-methyltransferase 1
LQTFPDGLRFDCGRNDTQRMLGNAVPSLAAEVIAREIRGQLLGKAVKKKKLQLLPPRRNQIPLPERVAKVPAAYRSLAGNHAAHPGEGRGNRARTRMAA